MFSNTRTFLIGLAGTVTSLTLEHVNLVISIACGLATLTFVVIGIVEKINKFRRK